MSTVALIGADGSGKTTISDLLLESFSSPLKYIYMGTAIKSSNITLPTNRLILYLKLRAHKKNNQNTGAVSEFREYKKVKRGKILATASMLNRLAEEWYRQLASWIYQMRGYVVLYDRHFIFEHAAHADDLRKQGIRLTDRIHLWSLYRLYPEPGLTIFLDAPAEILMARKNEWPIERLKKHQQAVLKQGALMTNFVKIDATQNVDKVYADVCDAILQYLNAEKV